MTSTRSSPCSTPTSCSGPTAARPACRSTSGGAEAVAGQALLWSRVDLTMRRALINGAAGIVTFLDGQPFSICAITIKGGRIAEIDFLADPERIAQLDLTVLDD